MLLAIDIGNSFTKFGIFESSTLLDKFSIPTTRDYSVDELAFDRLLRPAGRFFGIDTVIVSSVVPEMNDVIGPGLRKHLNVEPIFVDHTFDFGMKINYRPPSAAGVDRLVNASAAARKYGPPVIVCSFGTATTFDHVNEKSEYCGGAIAPGLRMMAESLHRSTSKLPLVVVEEPESSIGRTTEDSIAAGVYFGYFGLVHGILKRMIKELGKTPRIIATGGFAKPAAENVTFTDLVDENLTLDGLRMLGEQRRNQADADASRK